MQRGELKETSCCKKVPFFPKNAWAQCCYGFYMEDQNPWCWSAAIVFKNLQLKPQFSRETWTWGVVGDLRSTSTLSWIKEASPSLLTCFVMMLARYRELFNPPPAASVPKWHGKRTAEDKGMTKSQPPGCPVGLSLDKHPIPISR